MSKFHRRLSKLYINFLNLGDMPVRYWFFTALCLLLAVAAFLGRLWLDKAIEAKVDCASPPPPITSLTTSAYEPTRHEVDAVLIIDFSGSMEGESGSDPDKLRFQAAELMTASLAADIFPRTTRMGYIAFGKGMFVQQKLSSVEDVQNRLDMIEVLDDYPNTGGEEDWYQFTNIGGALSLAQDMLFTDDCEEEIEDHKENTPAVILLTDGEPTYGSQENTDAGIRRVVDELTNRGTNLFVVILRNPKKEESPRLREWRSIWDSLSRENPRVQYLEAQEAGQLENIYNKIRSRLVNEGARPGERKIYDPADPAAAIVMPPGLLQAHLLVAVYSKGVDVKLIAPDGTSFDTLEQNDARNELLQGERYYRYKIYQPMAGDWTLQTDAQQPLGYLLNVESLYSPQIAWFGVGTAYVRSDCRSQLPIVVITEQEVSSKPFHIEAALLESVLENDAFIEKEIALPAPVLQPDGTTYMLDVDPSWLDPDGLLRIQLSGTAEDGSLLNLAVNEVPSAVAPDNLLLTAPEKLICQHEQFQLSPPAILCDTEAEVSLVVDGPLQEDSLTGFLISPCTNQNEKMTPGGKTNSLEGTISPMTTAGLYGYSIDLRGQVAMANTREDAGTTDNQEEHTWSDWVTGTVELTWPAWIPERRRQLNTATWVFLILGLWKPLIVGLLLPVFRLLNLAPSGRYSMDEEGFGTSIYQLAMKRRKLFTVTVGRTPWNDIRRYDGFRPEKCRANVFCFIVNFVREVRNNQPFLYLVAMPFAGIFVESENEFSAAPEVNYSNYAVGQTDIYIRQSNEDDV